MATITLTDAQVQALAPLFALVGVSLDADAPADTAPAQPAKPAKVYRSAAGKAKAKAACDKAWADAKAKAGVKRVKDLTPAQRAEVDAQVKAIWAAVPKTRTTKA